jgi:hypothetical protein
MSWGAGVCALVFLLACLLFAYELSSPRRHRLRLALLLLPIVASLWIYGSAWLSIRTLRNLGLACASGDPVGVESCFASRVTVGVEDYERGPELVSRYMTTPRKKEEVEALRFHAGFSFSDPFHFYMVTCGDTDLGTDSAGMFRLALTPTGWKVDQEIYGGPPWRLPEIWTLAGCW